jgi:hypothetical protein
LKAQLLLVKAGLEARKLRRETLLAVKRNGLSRAKQKKEENGELKPSKGWTWRKKGSFPACFTGFFFRRKEQTVPNGFKAKAQSNLDGIYSLFLELAITTSPAMERRASSSNFDGAVSPESHIHAVFALR